MKEKDESYINQFEFIIPAFDTSFEVPTYGNFIKCVEATGEFKLSIGGQSNFSDMREGRKITRSTSEKFKRIVFSNESAEPIAVKLLIGVGNVDDDNLSLKDYSSYLVTGNFILPANSEQEIKATPAGTFHSQKTIIVSNTAPTSNVYIQDRLTANGGQRGHVLRANESHELNTSSSVVVVNDNPVDVTINYTQIIYGD